MSEERVWKDMWTLQALRRSSMGDPIDENGPSRFIYNRGTEEDMREQYDGYAQPTEVILAELRDSEGRVVARFDRIAEALSCVGGNISNSVKQAAMGY
jgi:hypothetical protein